MTEERCAVTELLVSACGCAWHRGGSVPRVTEGLLIERFRVAQYDNRCAAEEEHRIAAGTTIGLAITDETGDRVGWVCAACVQEITE